MATISKGDQKEMRARAEEWRGFRRNYLYSQAELAQALGIARRTIQSIEGEVTVCPSFAVQQKFLTLRRKLEMERQREEAERIKRERQASMESAQLAGMTSAARNYKYSSSIDRLFRRGPVRLGR